MRAAIENHIREVDAFYRPLIVRQAGRLSGGERLLTQFERAASAFSKCGRRQVSGVIERVNELAVLRQLLLDPGLASAVIEYEPAIAAGPKFDFVIRPPEGQTVFVEVKTVSPQSTIDLSSWRQPRYPSRQVILDAASHDAGEVPSTPPSFAARPAFLRYAIQTEAKLAAHVAVQPGHGILVFCSDGIGWRRHELEDFVRSYRLDSNRSDVSASEKLGTGECRPLDGFSALIRRQDSVDPSEWVNAENDYPKTPYVLNHAIASAHACSAASLR